MSTKPENQKKTRTSSARLSHALAASLSYFQRGIIEENQINMLPWSIDLIFLGFRLAFPAAQTATYHLYRASVIFTESRRCPRAWSLSYLSGDRWPLHILGQDDKKFPWTLPQLPSPRQTTTSARPDVWQFHHIPSVETRKKINMSAQLCMDRVAISCWWGWWESYRYFPFDWSFSRRAARRG